MAWIVKFEYMHLNMEFESPQLYFTMVVKAWSVAVHVPSSSSVSRTSTSHLLNDKCAHTIP